MSESSYVARTWLKRTCPFSFKFLLFMTEAGLLDQIKVIPCAPEDEDFEQVRSDLAEATGGKASFPTVEVEPGNFMTESDDLINYYAEKAGVGEQDFPVLEFYRAGLFERVLGLYRENRDLKAQIQQ
jgi:glutathione S-transferase